MSQWGSKYLGDQNYSAIDILKYYYGDSMYINTAEEISGIPASLRDTILTLVLQDKSPPASGAA